jgi:hypothetical protein
MKRTTLYLLLPLLLSLVLAPVALANDCPLPPCTDPCDPRSPGYWKNHPDAWPVDAITIGSIDYSQEDAIALMQTPVQGDKSLTLFKAVVAATLNVEAGCPAPCELQDCLDAARTLLTRCEEGPVGSNWRANTETWQELGEPLYECLEASYRDGDPCLPDSDPCPAPNPCPPPPECTPCEPRSPGYWKNHPEAWPLDTITIGGEEYTKAEAIAWMNSSVKGDKSITLFKAYVAVLLNQAAGCDLPCELRDCLDSAEARLTNHPVGSIWHANTEAWQKCGEPLYECLEASYQGA